LDSPVTKEEAKGAAVVEKKNWGRIFAADILSLGVVIAYLTHSFDQSMENMAVTLLVLFLLRIASNC
jgi:hypothetical protein